MKELETSLHLFQPPLYRVDNCKWTKTYNKALHSIKGNVTIDPVSVTSVISYGWVPGERTLVSEITRRPWLSHIGGDGLPVLELIPAHGRVWESQSNIAKRFVELLSDEAMHVCKDKTEIYLLLTGGLDSRIIAGVLSKLYKEGKLSAKPIALTWGASNSRDSVYAKRIADLLGFEWQNIILSHEHVLRNIEVTASELACMHTPECLHASQWLECLPEDSLVIAGSYGDSVGRAEFGGKHLLEINHFKPHNLYGLLKPEIFAYTSEQLMRESKALHSRSQGEPGYVLCEHEMQGFRMRGGLAHAMSLINKYCSVYQMFTSPEVYGYIWSIHPSLRTDRIYAEALENLNPDLARIPWARTNKALSGKTVKPDKKATKQYHDYTKWSCDILFAELSNYINPEWFDSTGMFQSTKIEEISILVKNSQQRVGRLNEVWLWLASFRQFVENIESTGKSVTYDLHQKNVISSDKVNVTGKMKTAILTSSRKRKSINTLAKNLRKIYRYLHNFFLKQQAIRDFPPSR